MARCSVAPLCEVNVARISCCPAVGWGAPALGSRSDGGHQGGEVHHGGDQGDMLRNYLLDSEPHGILFKWEKISNHTSITKQQSIINFKTFEPWFSYCNVIVSKLCSSWIALTFLFFSYFSVTWNESNQVLIKLCNNTQIYIRLNSAQILHKVYCRYALIQICFKLPLDLSKY